MVKPSPASTHPSAPRTSLARTPAPAARYPTTRPSHRHQPSRMNHRPQRPLGGDLLQHAATSSRRDTSHATTCTSQPSPTSSASSSAAPAPPDRAADQHQPTNTTRAGQMTRTTAPKPPVPPVINTARPGSNPPAASHRPRPHQPRRKDLPHAKQAEAHRSRVPRRAPQPRRRFG